MLSIDRILRWGPGQHYQAIIDRIGFISTQTVRYKEGGPYNICFIQDNISHFSMGAKIFHVSYTWRKPGLKYISFELFLKKKIPRFDV